MFTNNQIALICAAFIKGCEAINFNRSNETLLEKAEAFERYLEQDRSVK